MIKAFWSVCVFIISVVFIGCAEPRVVFKEVYIPTKCDIPKRERPAKGSNISKYLTDILIYTEGLENDLNFCRGENGS